MYKFILLLGLCSTSASDQMREFGKMPGIVACYYQDFRDSENEVFEGLLNIPTGKRNANATLCTHSYYMWAGIAKNASVIILSGDQDIKNNVFKKFTDLRKKCPNCEYLISMVSMEAIIPNSPSDEYAKILADPILRGKLVRNIVDFVKKYKFDGIELLWKFPTEDSKKLRAKKNFVSLLETLSDKFVDEALTLSIAVIADEATSEVYDHAKIADIVDFINLRTYEFHNTEDKDKKVGQSSPLYPSSKENSEERKVNVDNVVRHWISNGARPRKIILGIDFTGNAYTLSNPNKIGRGAPFSGAGYMEKPDYFPGYDDICLLEKDPKWKHLYDDEQQGSYIYNGNQLVAYEDVKSIKKKAEYIEKMGLGGAVIWIADKDDVKGKCGEKFPLLKILNRSIRYDTWGRL